MKPTIYGDTHIKKDRMPDTRRDIDNASGMSDKCHVNWPDRISDQLLKRQIECQNVCSIKCQMECRTDFQTESNRKSEQCQIEHQLVEVTYHATNDMLSSVQSKV